ncbi:MAG: hypothetical protein IJS80_03515 [Lachnospiraceae bacterium]|nr:hypothetical protein [Lachnospiraceae bacterium]
MADYITTYTEEHFYPTAPDPEKLKIEDVAHSLSMQCRGNGHVKTFFSVAQHCINCAKEAEARGYSPRVVLACLLHDASEAYMSDVPRPFKKELPSFIEWEDKLLDVIYKKWLDSALTPEETALVKTVDDDMLYYDLKVLLNETMDRPAPELRLELSYHVRPFKDVEREYLALFDRLKKALKA